MGWVKSTQQGIALALPTVTVSIKKERRLYVLNRLVLVNGFTLGSLRPRPSFLLRPCNLSHPHN